MPEVERDLALLVGKRDATIVFTLQNRWKPFKDVNLWWQEAITRRVNSICIRNIIQDNLKALTDTQIDDKILRTTKGTDQNWSYSALIYHQQKELILTFLELEAFSKSPVSRTFQCSKPTSWWNYLAVGHSRSITVRYTILIDFTSAVVICDMFAVFVCGSAIFLPFVKRLKFRH
jgi:hypothetical protein